MGFGDSLFWMMSLCTLLGFAIGVVRCPWTAWSSLQSLVDYAATSVSKRGKLYERTT